MHERISGALYQQSAAVSHASVRITGKARVDWDLIADKLLTSRWLGYPIMVFGLVAVLWVTIAGGERSQWVVV